MRWTFEKAFYGKKDRLSVRNIKQFLAQGYCPIPNTLFEGCTTRLSIAWATTTACAPGSKGLFPMP